MNIYLRKALFLGLFITTTLLVYGCSTTVAISSTDAASLPAYPAPNLPNDFELEEEAGQRGGFVTHVNVMANKRRQGTVSTSVSSWTGIMTYRDNSWTRQATGHIMMWSSWATRIDVSDTAGKRVGTIEQEVLGSSDHPWIIYSILDANGKMVARGELFEIFTTRSEIRLRDIQSNQVVAELELDRPDYGNFGDRWRISVRQPNAVDSRLLVFLAAFKTAIDNSGTPKP